MADQVDPKRIEATGTGGELASVLPAGLTKEALIAYMRGSAVVLVARTRTPDRIDPNGLPVTLAFWSDGHFIWSSESVAYVERYDLALPPEFINHTALYVEHWGDQPPKMDEEALRIAYKWLISGDKDTPS